MATPLTEPFSQPFSEFELDPILVAALTDQGITTSFPIQQLALPLALEGHDIIGQARTGSGKTLAFGLPLLQRADNTSAVVQALIVVPTRELCVQVTKDLSTVGKKRGVRVMSIYGGMPIEAQQRELEDPPPIVVGTPGRLLDLVRRGNLKLSTARNLVLDEADEMLDMGFLPDVEQLISLCSDDRQTMLFSATIPAAVAALARRYMKQPTFLTAEVDEDRLPPKLEQHFLEVHRLDKPRVLARILQAPERGQTYVFTQTKRMADRLVQELEELGTESIAIHGDLAQSTRERNLDRFRDNKVDVLVATEVAARGLDIEGATHVINYDCPGDETMYTHRVGRTGRAGNKGVAVTFAGHDEVERVNMIRRGVNAEDRPLTKVFSTSIELTELFKLPENRPWDHLSREPTPQRSRGPRGQASSGESNRSQVQRTQAKRSQATRSQANGSQASDTRANKSQNNARGAKVSDSRSTGRSEDKRAPSPARGLGRGPDRSRSRGEASTAEPAPPPATPTPEPAPEPTSGPAPGPTPEPAPGPTPSNDPTVRVRTRERTKAPAATTPPAGADQSSDGTRSRSRQSTSARSTTQSGGGSRSPSRRARSTGSSARQGANRRDNQEPSKSSRSGSRPSRSGGSGAQSSSRRSSESVRADSGEAGSGPRTATKRGDSARGDGRPAHARSLKVENLP